VYLIFRTAHVALLAILRILYLAEEQPTTYTLHMTGGWIATHRARVGRPLRGTASRRFRCCSRCHPAHSSVQGGAPDVKRATRRLSSAAKGMSAEFATRHVGTARDEDRSFMAVNVKAQIGVVEMCATSVHTTVTTLRR
jgi:hypothetical protein